MLGSCEHNSERLADCQLLKKDSCFTHLTTVALTKRGMEKARVQIWSYEHLAFLVSLVVAIDMAVLLPSLTTWQLPAPTVQSCGKRSRSVYTPMCKRLRSGKEEQRGSGNRWMGPLNVHRVDTLVVAHYNRGVVLRPQGAKYLFLFIQFLDKGGDTDGCNWYWHDDMLCDRALAFWMQSVTWLISKHSVRTAQ